MFVLNCLVDDSETLLVPAAQDPGQEALKKKSKKKATLQSEKEVHFKPVRCQKCKTQVAVYDSEEVYHFFNVLSSYT
uniref:Uncharacterized protein n=1 Tax=Romanomermis culicivorax TaxID=13658 RepID=A0A915KGV3_ROMCU